MRWPPVVTRLWRSGITCSGRAMVRYPLAATSTALNADAQAQGGERHRGDADEGTPSGGDAGSLWLVMLGHCTRGGRRGPLLRAKKLLFDANQAAVSLGPVIGDGPLRLAHVERAVAHQLAQTSLEPVLGLRVPRRLDRTARLRP